MPGIRPGADLSLLGSALPVNAYAGDPIGEWSVGAGFAHWCPTPMVIGWTLWGSLTLSGAEQLADVDDRVRADSRVRGQACVIDGRSLADFEPDAYALLCQRARSRPRTDLEMRTIVLRPGVPFLDAVAGGLTSTVGPRCAVRVFATVGDGIAWLRPFTDARIAPMIDAVRERATSEPEDLRRIRVALRCMLRDATPERLGRLLDASVDDLGETLRSHASSFDRELRRERTREAQWRLRFTTDSPTTIAYHLGFSSLQHFTTVFRRAAGVAPAQWRKEWAERPRAAIA